MVTSRLRTLMATTLLILSVTHAQDDSAGTEAPVQTTQLTDGVPTNPALSEAPPTPVPVYVSTGLADITISIQATLAPLASDDGESQLQALQPFREGAAKEGPEGASENATAETRPAEAAEEEGQVETGPGEDSTQTAALTGSPDATTEAADTGPVPGNTSPQLQGAQDVSKLSVALGTTLRSTLTAEGAESSTSSNAELNTQSDSLKAESINTANLSPRASDVSKYMDEPMMADSPNTETDERPIQTNKIISTIRDKMNNMSDTFADKSTVLDSRFDSVKESLNGSNGSKDDKGSINNENLNPFPPTSFGGKQDKNATKTKPNSLGHNIRQAMANASDDLMPEESHGDLAKMKVKSKPSKKIKIGKGSLESEEDQASNHSTTTGATVGNISESSSTTSSSTPGYLPNSFNTSANISRSLRNLTNSQMTQSLVNLTEQSGRVSLRARNGGSRPALLELQRSGWVTLVAMVSMTTRF